MIIIFLMINGVSAGAYATLVGSTMLPIKTYDNIDHDPMNTILNVFSKLKTKRRRCGYTILISPAGEKFINEFHMILDDVKDGMSVKHASDNFYKFQKAFWSISKSLLFGHKKKKIKKIRIWKADVRWTRVQRKK